MKKLFLLLGLSLAFIIDIHAQWQLVEGPTGGKIQSLAIDSTTNYLYAGTYGAGMFRSKDNGMHWEPLNDGLSNNFVTDITINKSNIFIGTEGGGIFLSTNNGESWTNINYGLTGSDLNITALASHGNVTAMISASNLYFLDNINLKWKRVSSTIGYKILSIAINDYMIVAGTENKGVLISTDNGNSWRNKNSSIYKAERIALNGEKIVAWEGAQLKLSTNYAESFVGIGGFIEKYKRSLGYNVYSIAFTEEALVVGANHGFFLSFDNGITWEHNTNFEKQINSITSTKENIFIGTETDGIYKSTDCGKSWIKRNDGLYAINSQSINTVADKIYIGTNGNGVYKSFNDNCDNWVNASNGLLEHDIKSLTPYQNNLYACLYGGVYFTNNEGKDWYPHNRKINNLQAMSFVVCNNVFLVGTLSNGIYQLNTDETKLIYGDVGYGNPTVWSMIENENRVIAGTSNGLVILNYTGSYWNSTKYGSSEVKSITKNGNTVYAATCGNGIYVSTNGGQNWSTINCSLKINSILTSGENLIVGTDNGIYTSLDNGLSWNSLGSNLANYKVLSLLEKNDFLYAGTFNGGVWKHKLSEINKNLTVSVKEINLVAEASNNANFEIISNTNWTISCSENWITTNQTNGNGNSTIMLSVNANNSGSRTAYVLISRSGVISQKIKVNQAGSISSSIDIENNNLTIGSTENSSTSFEIVSNTNWYAESDQDWLTLDKNEGCNNSKIIITAKENPTNNERIAIIRAVGNELPVKQIKVTQEASLPFLNTSVETLSILPAANSSSNFEIISNTNWHIENNQNWLTIKNYDGSGNDIVSLVTEANNETTERSATIKIISNSGISKNIVITQQGKTNESDSLWKKINGPYGGSISIIEKDNETGYIYAGSEGGGVLLSKDNGNSWVQKNKGLTPQGMMVNSIYINANNVYIGTRDGIYLSSDEGETWKSIDNGLASRWINSVVVQNNTIFTLTNNTIYKSIDNGLIWEETSNTLGTNIKPLCIAVKNNIVFAGTTNGIYRSFDNGATWVHNKYSFEITSFEVDGDNIYACLQSSVGDDVCYSSNNGDDWYSANHTPFIDLSPTIHANGNNVYVGTYWGIDYSSDNCKNWTKIYAGNSDVNTILETEGKILVGTTKGGILTSTNNGIEWSSTNNGIADLTINTVVFNDNKLYIGTYEEGIFTTNNDGESWTQLNNGLLSKNVKAIAFKDNLIFAGTDKGLYLSDDEGSNWVGCNDGMNEKDITSILSLGNYIYVGTRIEGVYFSPDNGSTWISNNNGLDNNIYALASNGRNILAGSEGYVYHTTSDYWFKYSDLLGNDVYSLVFNGDTAYAASDKGIYYYTYNINQLGYWKKVGDLLKSEDARTLISKGNNIIVGLNGNGVKITSVNSTKLFEINEGLTNKNILSLASNDNYIYAGTKGNGLWKRRYSDIIKLSVSKKNLNVGCNLNSKVSFNIYSNIKWNISSSENWFSINSIVGSGDALITITANGNSSLNPRSATIKISGEGVADQLLTITQEGFVPLLDVSSNLLSLNAASNSSTSFDIISNINWSIENNQDWIKINSLSGFGNTKIIVTATENKTVNPRTATITISGTGVESKTITITQAGATPILSVNTASLNLAALNGSAIFSITSNTTWTISSDQSWLSLSNTNGSNNASITVTASNNVSITPRTATITITGTGVTSKTITINQTGTTRFLTVTPTTLSINAGENNNTSFELKSNVKWTISRDQNWLSVSNIEGENSSLVNVWATANENTEPRTATITITGEGVETKYITVTQKAKVTSPVLTVSSNSLFYEQSGWPFNTVNITSNTNWYLNCDQPWILFSNMAGENNGSIDIFAIPNEDPNPRYANIFVFGDNAIPQIINVTQAGTDPYFGPFITTYPNLLNFTADASNPSYFEINSNIYWTITCDQPWISLSNDNGNSYSNIGVTALTNESLVSRTATITIMGEGGLVNTINVTQAGKTPTLNVDPTTLSLSALSNSTNFNINSNTAWTISSDQNWLSLSSYNGANNATITVTANENASINSRTATITVTGTGVAAKTITVTQVGTTPTLTVDQTALSMVPAMGSTNFSITSNTGWTISSDQNWISLSSDNGANNATITVTANENASINPRTATITVAGTGVAAKTITVTQVGTTPTLTVDQATLSMAAAMGSTNFSIASNTAWTISTDQNWLSLSSDNGANNATITVTANENTSTAPRTATITVAGTGVAAKTITVNQAGITPTLTVDQTALSMAAAMGSTNFSITSNTGWTISSDQNWLNLSSDNGANNATITVTANENTSINLRTATITVTGTGVAAKTITVNQAGITPTLTVDQTALSTAAAMGSTNFSITSNTGWTISSDQNWLSLSSDNGANNATITVNANENASINSRTATITVTGTGVAAKTITVTQVGTTPTLTVDQTALSMAAAMGSTNFSITSNTGWTISSDQNWISLSSDSGANNATITVNANENTSINTRTTTLTVTGTGVAAKTITVNQAGATPTLTVDQTALSIAAAMGSTNFSIASNTAWTTSTDQNWLSLSSDNGANNATITVTANENTSINSRTATITVIGTGVTAKTITVNQAGATPTLTVDQTALSMDAEMGSTNFSIASNTAWSISTDQNWLSLSSDNGANNATLTVTANENASINSRTATITVTGTGVAAKTITVTQVGTTPTLTVDQTALSMAAAMGSTNFSIASNIGWTISCNQNWINLSSTNGTNNGTITVTASENLHVSPRTATITVAGTGVTAKNISVNQSGAAPMLTVNPANIGIDAIANSSAYFEITSNIDWVINCSADWINIDKHSGSNNSTISIATLENISINPRTTKIQIIGNGTINRSIDVTQNGAPLKITVNPNSLNLNSVESSSASFEITSNGDWTLFSNQNWLKLNKTSGTGNSSITVTASANTNTSSRNAIVTVRGNNGVVEYVNVTQEPASPTLSVSSNNVSAAASNVSTGSFKIYSNSNWVIESNSNWITLDKTAGFGYTQIGITVSQNPLGNIRSGQLTIKCNGLNDLVVNVNQSAAFINVSPLQITLNASQASSTFNIMSNVGWTIEESQDWINLDRLQGSGSGTINLQATENTSTAKRAASIKVKCSDDYYKTINITQNGSTANLTVNPSNLDFGYNETSLSIYIESNTNWKIQSDRTWLTMSPMEGNGNSSVLVTASQNTTIDSRPATITIVGDGVNSNRIIYVTQNALPHLIASPQSLSLNSSEGSNGTLSVSSNLNWTASVDQDWLSLSKSSGFGSSSIILTASANTEKSDRIATVTFSATGIDSKTVTVTQNALSTDVTNDNGEIVRIYPNPFNDKINVSIPELGLSRAAISIYSSYGILVYTQKLTELNTEISQTDLKPGIYIAKIMYGDKIYSKVLIKI